MDRDLPHNLRSTAALLEQMDAETCRARAPWLDEAAAEIERLRAKVAAVERLTQTPTVDGPNGANLRLASIRAELGVAVHDPRLND